MPGNHEPTCLFEAARCDGDSDGDGDGDDDQALAGNMHGRTARLAPGLRLLGWGGGVTATEDGAPVWPGWPTATEEGLATGLSELLHSHGGAGDELVLLTHSGPAGVSTSVVSGVDPNDPTAPGVREHWIESGSVALLGLLARPSQQRRVLVALHGHTHAGVGSSMLGRVRVVNPGSLRYGSTYSLLQLQRDGERWRVARADHRQLGSCSGGGGIPNSRWHT